MNDLLDVVGLMIKGKPCARIALFSLVFRRKKYVLKLFLKSCVIRIENDRFMCLCVCS